MIPGITGSQLVCSYLYDNGTQVVPFTTGYSTGANGSVTYDTSSIIISAGNMDTIVNERSTRTTNTIDLTNVKKIYIDWQVSMSGLSQVASLVVSTVQTATYSTNNAILSYTTAFSRRLEALDVTALSGNYYVKVHARDNRTTSGLNTTQVTVYAIYLEY